MQSTTRQKSVIGLSWLIALLALVAAAAGLLWQRGAGPIEVQNVWGQTIQLRGTGLYMYDSVAGAAQEIGQDTVTLLLGIPLLVISILLFRRGSLRGKLLLTGTLGYFLYTYTAMAMLTTYNELFLVYVALCSLSLFAFVMALTSIDVAALPAHFAASFPRRTVAGFTLFVGALLTLMWLGRIVPTLLAGRPPVGIDNYTTLVIQVLDLGVIVPTAVLAGVLLLRRAAWGYLLSSVVLVKAFTLMAAVSAMSIAQIVAGVAVSPVEVGVFAGFALVDAGLLGFMLRSLQEIPVLSPAPVEGLRTRIATSAP
jgi:hypothetical protein